MRYLLFCFYLIVSCCISCQKYQGPHDFVSMQCAIDAYGTQVANGCGMRLLLIDNVTPSPDTAFCMAFMSNRPLILEEAKVVSQTLVDNFLTWLRKNPSVSRYKNFSQVEITEIGLKISFWDKEMARLPSPYIAEILFTDNTFFYYQKDCETQELRLILKEPYTNPQK